MTLSSGSTREILDGDDREILEAVDAVRTAQRLAADRAAEYADLGRHYTEAGGRLNAANTHVEVLRRDLHMLIEGETA